MSTLTTERAMSGPSRGSRGLTYCGSPLLSICPSPLPLTMRNGDIVQWTGPLLPLLGQHGRRPVGPKFPTSHPCGPISLPACEASGNVVPAVVGGCSIRSFRVEPPLPASPRPFLSDARPSATSTATSTRTRPPAFGCDNQSDRQPVPPGRSGRSVGDGGGGGKKPSVTTGTTHRPPQVFGPWPMRFSFGFRLEYHP